MRIALAVSAALLLAGTAHVHPAHAQMTTQPHAAAPQAQTQQFGTTGQNQAYATATRTQSWTPRQSQSGAMAPSQTRSYGATGSQMSAQGQAPQGSSSSSCNDVRMQGQTLIAFCQKPDGTWQTSAIGPVSQCAGDIQNVDGHLTCSKSGVGSSTPPARPPSTRTQPRS